MSSIRTSDLILGVVIIGGVIGGTLYMFGPKKNDVVESQKTEQSTSFTPMQKPKHNPLSKNKPEPVMTTTDTGVVIEQGQRTGPAPKAMKDEVPLARLLEMLKSSDPELRTDAFWTIRYAPDLYELGDVQPFLLTGVVDGNEDVRTAAVAASGEYTDNPNIIRVYDVVLNKGTDPEAKQEVIQHMFNMNYSLEVEHQLIFRLFDNDEMVGDAALDVLNHYSEDDTLTLEEAKKKYENFRKGAL